jgi:hypothetical protein
MNTSRSWLASLLVAVGVAAGLAEAQCYYLPVPQAPDMCNPGYYRYNCQGNLYGPYHNVYPQFGPWQGMVPGPSVPWIREQMYRQAGYNPPPQPQPPGPDIARQAYAPYGMQPGYAAMQGPGHPGGYPGLWTNPFVRSPRDFFMYGDDPADSPYRYGAAGTAAPPSVTDREISIGFSRETVIVPGR